MTMTPSVALHEAEGSVRPRARPHASHPACAPARRVAPRCSARGCVAGGGGRLRIAIAAWAHSYAFCALARRRDAAANTQFDWYQRYAGLRPVFAKYLVRPGRLLVTGCGNSREWWGSARHDARDCMAVARVGVACATPQRTSECGIERGRDSRRRASRRRDDGLDVAPPRRWARRRTAATMGSTSCRSDDGLDVTLQRRWARRRAAATMGLTSRPWDDGLDVEPLGWRHTLRYRPHAPTLTLP